jgi:hypothetical protein
MTPEMQAMIETAARKLQADLRATMAAAGPLNIAGALQVVALAEGAPPDAFPTWAAGFTSCLDYVLAEPELMATVARWWSDEARVAGVAGGKAALQTRAGTEVFSAALFSRGLGGANG